MLSSKKHYSLVLLIALIAAAYLLRPSHVGHEIVEQFSSLSSVVKLQPIAEGLKMPVDLLESPDGSGRLFVVEKGGLVKIIKGSEVLPKPYIDLSAEVSEGMEQGLLSLAFHPKFAINGRIFVDYTDKNGDTRIDEIVAADPKSDEVSAVNRRIVLFYKQPYRNHNGGQLLFGSDGYLYIPSGDGGSAGDPQNNAQNLNTYLGKVLRIDVDQNSSVDFNSGPSYGIPGDNPFVGRTDARAEIWSYGMRNPWRCAFEQTGNRRLFCADVGQDKIEEIDIIERGGNYGWPMYEGRNCYRPPCSPEGMIMPISQYDHSEGFSITGGFVYRGKEIKSLAGRYVFGDFGTGKIWSIPTNSKDQSGSLAGPVEPEFLLSSGAQISSFGQDQAGELYLVDFSGKISKLVSSSGK